MIPIHRSPVPSRARRWALLAAGVALFLLAAGLWWRTHHATVHDIRLSSSLQDWQAYEGSWVSVEGAISDVRNGRGDKLISSSAVPDDLQFSGEVRFDSETDMEWGDAGLVLRVANPAPGTDSFNGYYFGLRPVSRELLFGREDFDYVNLAIQPLSEPLELGAWYHLHVRAKGCQFEAEVSNSQGEQIGGAQVNDRDCHFLQGAVGLRSYSMLTSWRHLEIRGLR